MARSGNRSPGHRDRDRARQHEGEFGLAEGHHGWDGGAGSRDHGDLQPSGGIWAKSPGDGDHMVSVLGDTGYQRRCGEITVGGSRFLSLAAWHVPGPPQWGQQLCGRREATHLSSSLSQAKLG